MCCSGQKPHAPEVVELLQPNRPSGSQILELYIQRSSDNSDNCTLQHYKGSENYDSEKADGLASHFGYLATPKGIGLFHKAVEVLVDAEMDIRTNRTKNGTSPAQLHGPGPKTN